MFFYRDIGIDLGTANTLVHVKGRGIVINEPSVVAVDQQNGRVLAVGESAKKMIGRTPGNITALRPVKDGVIADFEYTQAMLRYFLKKATRHKGPFSRTRVVICVPSGVTAVEERAVKEAAKSAGADIAQLIEEPMAASIGAGLEVNEPTGNMIVDIGGGTTEVAIISLGGIVTSRSIRIAGNEMDNVIINHVKKTYNLIIGERTAEEIKIQIGCAYLDEDIKNASLDVRGRDTITGLPRTVNITAKDIYQALTEPVGSIIEAIKTCLEKSPPELAADIMSRGIMMAGGGSMLHGFQELVIRETGIMAILAEEALSAVVIGTGKVLENIHVLSKRK